MSIGQVQPLNPQVAPANAPEQPAAARPENGRRPLAELILVTIGIAAAAIYSPTFAFGLAVGAGNYCVMVPIALGLIKFLGWPPPPRRELREGQVITASLIAPIKEELVFRGCLQPFLESELVKNFPAISYAFLGAQITLATITAITITAIIFGALHLRNPHEGARVQAVFATYAGLLFGYMRSRYGLLASIGAHVGNNHLISCLAVIAGQNRRDPAPAAQ